MNAAQAAQLAEIESLLAERRKIEQWLTTLESRREATPVHVYERVHADYTTKCAAAQAALQGRMDAVRTVAASLAQTLAEHEAGISGRRDARAEAELRALVGEFSEDEWERRRMTLDDELATMQEERDGVARELEVLHALLAEAEPGTSVPAVAAVVAPAAEPVTAPMAEPTAAPEVRAPVFERIVEPVTQEEAAPVAEVEEMVEAEEFIPAFDEPVTTSHHPTPTTKPDWASVFSSKPDAIDDEGPFAEPAAPPAPAPEPAAAPPAEERDELAFLRSVLGRSTPAAAPSRPTPAPETPPRPLEMPADEARASGAFPAANTRPLSGPTPSTSQAARSLACQECGAMNFPTEWYCEKCGGELAAY